MKNSVPLLLIIAGAVALASRTSGGLSFGGDVGSKVTVEDETAKQLNQLIDDLATGGGQMEFASADFALRVNKGATVSQRYNLDGIAAMLEWLRSLNFYGNQGMPVSGAFVRPEYMSREQWDAAQKAAGNPSPSSAGYTAWLAQYYPNGQWGGF